VTLRCLLFSSLALLAVIPSAARAEEGVKIRHPSVGADSVAINADSLAVDDADKTATFTGHVVIADGATRMTCSRAVIWYRGTTAHDSSIDSIACEP
jgi:lipopolysaccharide export system protein LptA